MPFEVGEWSQLSDNLFLFLASQFLASSMLRATPVPVHGTHLQATAVQTSITQPSASLHGSHPSASLEAIHALSHLPISHPHSFSDHSLFPFLPLYPCCCEPCPFTFLPSAAVSFRIIIVLCIEKAKRATKTAPLHTDTHCSALCYCSQEAFDENPSFVLAVCCRTQDLILSEQCITGGDSDFACGL